MTHTIHALIGPTASGKTAHAIEIAGKHDSVIINMDAMQMYSDLRIITARPSQTEEALAPHRLYGVLPATTRGNAGLWCEMAVQEIRAAWQAGKLPLLVGGTGMYLKSLMEGLAAIPNISEETKAKVAELFSVPSEQGGEQSRCAYEALRELDPIMAARLEAGDSQRIQRALEVFFETGESLAVWQKKPMQPFFSDVSYTIYSIMPPRERLYANINTRFEIMMRSGAIEEVVALKDAFKQGYFQRDEGQSDQDMIKAQSLPLFKALGVPEIMAYLDGKITLEEATVRAQQLTRNYAKRQMTWIRNQLPDAKPITSSSAS